MIRTISIASAPRAGVFFCFNVPSICLTEQAKSDELNPSDIDTTLYRLAEEVMPVEGVEGIYQGITENGTSCIVIMISNDDELLRERLPVERDGIPIEIEISGTLNAL